MSESTSIWNRRTNEKSTFLASTGVRLTDKSESLLAKEINDRTHDENTTIITTTSTIQEHLETSSAHQYNKEEDQLDSNGLVIVNLEDQPDAHILLATWTVWFLHRGPGVKISNYLSATKQLGDFSTVEQFWKMYTHFTPLYKLPFTSEFQLFRKGVKPIWEDATNIHGGKWVARLKRGSIQSSGGAGTGGGSSVPLSGKLSSSKLYGLSSLDQTNASASTTTGTTKSFSPSETAKLRHKAALMWERVVLSLVGGELASDLDDDEIVGVVVSVRRDEDILSVWNRTSSPEVTTKIKEALERVIDMPDLVLEYKIHTVSIKEGAEKQASYERHHSQHQHHHHQHHHYHHNHNHHPYPHSHHSYHPSHHSHSHATHSHSHATHSHSHPHTSTSSAFDRSSAYEKNSDSGLGLFRPPSTK